MRLAMVLLLAFASAAPAMPWGASTPASNPYAVAVRSALADARRLGPQAAFTRYMSLAQVPVKDREAWANVLNLWVNMVSREAVLVRPRRVNDTLLAVNIIAYGWNPDTWESLANEDPYGHIQVNLIVGKKGQKKFFKADKANKAGWYEIDPPDKARPVPALAPWTDVGAHAELVALTNSAVPIVRGDWWFSRAAIQFGRVGTGYYDWLQVKDRDAFDKLVGLDIKASQNVHREVATIVRRSGVSNFPRQIFRFQSVTGGYWQTRDRITDNKDAGNALRQLDTDYVHEAERIFGVLPNGLFAFFLANADGVRQDSAPDGVGSDKTAPGNDGKIHIGVSCQRCHTESLKPIVDWARQVYRGSLRLNVADPVKAQRLQQLYLDEYQESFDDDVTYYTKRLNRLTGWTTEESSKAIGQAWAWYQEANVMPAELAGELGLDEKVYLERLRSYFKTNQLSDSVLASHIADPPIPIRRDDVEQLYVIVAPIVLGESK